MVSLEVAIEPGRIRGAWTSDEAVRTFKGVPYARPPVGDLRWRAPAPLEAWSGVRPATSFARSAMQAPAPPGSIWPPTKGLSKRSLFNLMYLATRESSEDCLYLNLWTPSQSDDARLPVMVWIHGGGWRVGEGSHPNYDGEALARRGVVVVTFNYRLWRFGCLAHPELSAESPNGVSGNYGLLDQIAVLEWVQANIVAFGGDPDRVTIFGQSIGSVCVGALMASPLAAGLFARAIGQSGAEISATLKSASPTKRTRLADAEAGGVHFIKCLGVDTIAEARCMTTAALVALPHVAGFDPAGQIVDGCVLPETIHSIFASGRQNDAPLLLGATADEWTIFSNTPDSPDALRAAAQDFGALRDEFLALYGGEDDARRSFERVFADRQFWWQIWSWARLQRRTGLAPVYFYEFSRAPRLAETTYWENSAERLGAFHSAEIPYVFGNFDPAVFAIGQADHALSDVIGAYWTTFAAHGDPNAPGLPSWPRFDRDGLVMALDESVSPRPFSRAREMAFWDRYLAARGEPLAI